MYHSMGVDESEESSEEYDIENLKKQVSIPHDKLQSIVYNDQKYSMTVHELLSQGLVEIKKEQLEYALVYFSQAEKVLQYGASCGRTIDRNLIICALHNEACSYQKLGDLTKAAKYIEAIIYNFKTHLKSFQSSPTASNIIESAMLKSLPEFNRVSLTKKLQLAQYLLQFCSVNSQMKIRKTALDTARSAIELYKTFFQDLKSQFRTLHSFNISSSVYRQKIRTILKEFNSFCDDPQTAHLDTYIKIAKHSVKKWMNAVKQPCKSKASIEKHFGKYSIGNFVQMIPLQYGNAPEKLDGQGIIKELMHCSMGYFQIATEYRLMAEEKYEDNVRTKGNSEEYIYSKIYHLFCIIFMAMYVPYDLLFMEQILSSFEHNYKVCLTNYPYPENFYKPPLHLLFSSPVIEIRRSREKKKKVSTSTSKKHKKSTMNYSSSKKQHSHSKVKIVSGKKKQPTANEEYFASKLENGGIEETTHRNHRMRSNQSKRSDHSSAKKIEPQNRVRMSTEQSRQKRLHTSTSQHEDFILPGVKRREKSKHQYLPQPPYMPSILDFKFGQKQKNLCFTPDSKSTTRKRKPSTQMSTNKNLCTKTKQKNMAKKHSKQLLNCNKSPKHKPKVVPKKKKKNVTITSYYL